MPPLPGAARRDREETNGMIRVAKFVRCDRDRDKWLIIRGKDTRNQWLQLLDNVTDKNKSIKRFFLVDALKDEKERIEKIKQ